MWQSHLCLLMAAAACLSGVIAQFSSPDANCSFLSFGTRLQARTESPGPCMEAQDANTRYRCALPATADVLTGARLPARTLARAAATA